MAGPLFTRMHPCNPYPQGVPVPRAGGQGGMGNLPRGTGGRAYNLHNPGFPIPCTNPRIAPYAAHTGPLPPVQCMGIPLPPSGPVWAQGGRILGPVRATPPAQGCRLPRAGGAGDRVPRGPTWAGVYLPVGRCFAELTTPLGRNAQNPRPWGRGFCRGLGGGPGGRGC